MLFGGGGGGSSQVVFDAATVNATSGSSLVHTFSHTCSGSNRALLVSIACAGVINSVTYNSVSMSLVDTVTESAGTAAIYKLSNPASGANNVVITYSPGVTSFSNACAMSFTGANQTTGSLTGTAVKANNFGGNPSLNVSSAATEIVVDCVCYRVNGTLTVGASQTQRMNSDPFIDVHGGASTEPGAATTTMSWTIGTDGVTTHVAVAVKP